MKLADVMHRDVEIISGDTTVREAARRMSESEIGVLPVTEDGQVAGMVTDRDLVVRSVAKGDDPDQTRVSSAMTRDVECCYDDDSVDEASRRMSDRQVQRLLVLNHDEELVGIVSLGDLARARGSAQAVTHALEEIKGPTKPSAAGAHQAGH